MSNLPLNPILAGMHPDPTICRVGKNFYIATSSFGQFPGVPLYESQDLQNWRFVRHILSRPSQLPFQPNQNFVAGGIFAPTLRHDGKRFYLVTTNIGNGGHFIVTTEDPSAEWSDPIWVDQDHQGGIDPSLSFLEDGRTLFQATAEPERGEAAGLVQFEIDPLSGTGLTARKVISQGFGGKAVEGPHLFSRGSYWYLLAAEGGTEANHHVTIGRSLSPWGPFTPCPHNPLFTHAGRESSIQNTGHADLVSDAAGNWWMVFLGIRTIGYPPVHICGRETFIAPVEWINDWPVVNEGQPVQESTPMERGELCTHWEANFEDAPPGRRWITVGSTYDSASEFDTGSGTRLKALSSDLATMGPIGFLGTPLTEKSTCCTLSTGPIPQEAEGGLCVYMNWNGYYSIGVRHHGDYSYVRFTKRVLDMVTIEEFPIASSDEYRFRVVLTSDSDAWKPESSSFIFYASRSNEPLAEIGRGVSRLLSTEVIGGFSGLFIGPYSISSTNNASMKLLHFNCANTQ